MKGLVSISAVGFLAVLVVLTVGGRVAVVSTFGSSMEPGFRAGDLAVLVLASDYGVGDVVGYRSDDLDTVVMHRIVDVQGDRFVLQGDNNDWLDPEMPTEDDMVGELALRIPQGGVWLQRLTSAPALGVMAFGLLASGGAAVRSRRRGGRRRVSRGSDRPATKRPTGSSSPLLAKVEPAAVGAAALVLGLLGGLLAAAAFPRALVGPGEVGYEQRTAFAYSADAPNGPVYPDGQVETGDVVFRQLVDDLDVTLDWTFEAPPGSPRPTDVDGQLVLSMLVADGSGWSQTIPLAEETIDAPTATVAGTVDLRRIERLITSVQNATGTTASSHTLTLTADIDVAAEVAGETVQRTFEPSVAFTLDPLRLQPPTAGDNGDPFVITRSDPITVPGAGTAELSVAGRSISVDAARVIAFVLLGLAVLVGLVAAVLAAHRRGRSAEELTEDRYRHLFVDAVGMAAAQGRTVVEVSSIDGLVALAQRLDLPIVRAPLLDGGTVFVVEDLQTHYRFRRSGGPERSRDGVAPHETSSS